MARKSDNNDSSASSPRPPAPSSATSGFFQSPPSITNQFYEDAAFQRALHLFLPPATLDAATPELARFGAHCVSAATRRNTLDAEAHPPHVRHWDAFGQRRDELVTSEGWRASGATAAREGLVSIGYDTARWGACARSVQFFKTQLWGPASCGVTCPSAMTDGAAALLDRHVDDEQTPAATRQVLRAARRRLLSRDPREAWTSGQWMTERPGGSDVRETETRATYAPLQSDEEVASDGSPLGAWAIDGFKWFSSATDADMTVLLAKTGAGDELSAFFAPTRRRRRHSTATDDDDQDASVPNGILIQRLKSKLGTRPLPTAELELHGMRAHLLGPAGAGVREISAILNITRIHTAVGAISGWGAGLAVARAYARVRRVAASGTPARPLLADVPLHVRGLAAQHAQYRAYTLLTHFVASLLGQVECAPASPADSTTTNPTLRPPAAHAAPLLRLLTPALKAQAALAAIAGLRFAMESLGGLGYVEAAHASDAPGLNVARLFRDACVLSIWEGTTDVLAGDAARAVKGTRAALEAWVVGALARWDAGAAVQGLREAGALAALGVRWRALRALLDADAGALGYRGRELLEGVAGVACGVLLVEDAARDRDAVAGELARRWCVEGATGDGWREAAAWDRRIVFGDGEAAEMRDGGGAKL